MKKTDKTKTWIKKHVAWKYEWSMRLEDIYVYNTECTQQPGNFLSISPKQLRWYKKLWMNYGNQF